MKTAAGTSYSRPMRRERSHNCYLKRRMSAMVNRYTRHEIAPNQMPGMEATTAFVTAADYDKLLADYSAMVAESAAAVRRQVTDWTSAADAKEEEDNNYRLIQRQGDLLCGVVNALKGEPPEDTLWSHHDAPELAQALRAENDQRKADDAIEFRAMEALVSENDMLRKRIDSLTTELA